MSEKWGRGQPKFEPTRDLHNQAKLMKALGIPEDRICKTITNPRTEKPVAPMTLARAFAPELESGATELHAVTAPLDPETKRLRRLSPGALADEALALKKRIDAIKDEAIRRGLKTAEGEAGHHAVAARLAGPHRARAAPQGPRYHRSRVYRPLHPHSADRLAADHQAPPAIPPRRRSRRVSGIRHHHTGAGCAGRRSSVTAGAARFPAALRRRRSSITSFAGHIGYDAAAGPYR